MSKPKIYAFNNGGSRDWWYALAIAEDGTVLASHVCSHEGFMPHDLGVTSTWKHDLYNAHYPDGWEIEFVSYDDVATHEGLQKAFSLNTKQTAEDGNE